MWNQGLSRRLPTGPVTCHLNPFICTQVSCIAVLHQVSCLLLFAALSLGNHCVVPVVHLYLVHGMTCLTLIRDVHLVFLWTGKKWQSYSCTKCAGKSWKVCCWQCFLQRNCILLLPPPPSPLRSHSGEDSLLGTAPSLILATTDAFLASFIPLAATDASFTSCAIDW